MKTISKEDLRRMLQYAGKYQISVQFWGEGNTNVYIEKDGVSLTDFGGLEPGEAVSKTVEYLDRINNVIGYATPQSEVMTLEKLNRIDSCTSSIIKGWLAYTTESVVDISKAYQLFKAKSEQLQAQLEATTTIRTDNSKVIANLQTELEQVKAEREWISVEDRLPENNKQHLILINGDSFYTGDYDVMYKEWLNPFGDRIEEKVTHWKPLPSAPKALQSTKQ